MESFKAGITKPVIAVRATTITIGALTNPAVTAASPMTNAPTILIAEPMGRGILTPASLSN